MGTLLRAKLQAASIVTSPQAFDVSGETRTPKAAVYEIGPTLTAGTLVDGARFGCGMTDGTTQRSLGVQMEDGVAGNNADNEGRQDTATVVQFPNAASSAINGEGAWSTWNAGGSSLTWPNFLGNNFLINAVYFMDGDWSVQEFTGSSSSNVEVTLSGLSFAPDFCFSQSHYAAYSADGTWSSSRVSLGYAIKLTASTSQQIAFTDEQTDSAVPTECNTILRDDAIAVKLTEAGGEGARLQVTGWTSDGLKITTRNNSEAITTSLLIGRTGRRMWCGVPSLVTSSTGTKTITEPGFTAESYFMIATDLASINGHSSGNTTSKWSHGVYTGAESACIGVQVEDNAATSDTRSITDSIIAHVLDDAAGVSWKASHSSFTDDVGPVISIDDASAADRKVGMVVFGGLVLVSGETVGIADATTAVFSSLQSGETVGIADDTTAVFSSLQSGETVAIADATTAVFSTLEIGETVGIFDAAEFVSSMLSAETVEIVDGAVFVFSGSNAALVSDETVGISDAALFTSYFRSDETVGILDEALLNFSALQALETENILDEGVLWGTGVAAIANETVGISDASQFVFGSLLTSGETVGILDNFNFGAGLIPGHAGPGRGRTVEGGAVRGSTKDGGSLKGGSL